MSMDDGKKLFINRELSWLEFNHRVLDLATSKEVPLGEQLRFASIYNSNLDEFFMIRVGSLYDQTLLKNETRENKTGMTAKQQLTAIMPKVKNIQQHCDKIVVKLYSKLQKVGFQKVNFAELTKDEEVFWKRYFDNELFPVLSPQIIDRRHPFPFLRNGEPYVGTMLTSGKSEKMLFGLIPISTYFDRVIFVTNGNETKYAFVEELILHFSHLAFGKANLLSKTLFRVTRNADLDVEEGMFDHDIDYRVVMSELLKKRRKLAAVRLQFWERPPANIKKFLCEKLLLPAEQSYTQRAPLDSSVFMRLASKLKNLEDAELFYPYRRAVAFPRGMRLYDEVQRRDILMNYPYHSIRPFIQMLNEAAQDPDVVSIKMTLYRVADDSKIIEALIAAAENGKEVVTIVELRARFDEQNNIDWSKQLEQAGCTVIYGFTDYKVHSKLLLITKKCAEGFSYISQVGTGNYNEKTSEQYTDLSFLTSSQRLGEEIATVFNNLAVERLTEEVDSLIVAPLCFKTVLLEEIFREAEYQKQGGEGCILLKCNSISDKDIIEALSAASNAGVKVRMVVRGICCLQAGLAHLSENIEVRSIVGRYLEHSRIYAFGGEERPRIYIASGDFLTRNTERRVEVGVRIEDPEIQKTLFDVLHMQLADNVNARIMQPDGSYMKVKRRKADSRVDSQLDMYAYFEHKASKMTVISEQDLKQQPISKPALSTVFISQQAMRRIARKRRKHRRSK